MLIIVRQLGANIIETVERSRSRSPPATASSVSSAIDIQIASDRTQTIRASVHDVEVTLLLSVLLVVVVFLRSARATTIPTIAMPPILGTFAVMCLGYSLNPR